MPIVESDYTGSRWVRNRHLQTILPVLFDHLKANYTRERIVLDDGDFLDLDWMYTNSSRVLILFHGLEGSSQSHYMKALANFAHKLNWNVCAVNFRSCSGEMNRKLQSYHSGATADVHEVIKHILEQKPFNKLAAAGFSLGGNVLLKYLGEQIYTTAAGITRAAAVSVPVHLADCSAELAKSHNQIYLNRFLKSLKRKMNDKSMQFPGSVDANRLNNLRNLAEFDQYFTAPIHGFIDAAEYYSRCSSLQFLADIKRPVLLINALNDPFLTASCYPSHIAQQSTNLYLETPKHGGHVGFTLHHLSSKNWLNHRIMTFISDKE